MLDKIVRFDRKFTIEIGFKENFFESAFDFSDEKDHEYIISTHASGFELKRSEKCLFRGNPFAKFYFYNTLAQLKPTTQAIPHSLYFHEIGTINIYKEYNSNGYKVFEVFLDNKPCALVEYKGNMFNTKGVYKVSVTDIQELNINIGIFVFAYIHNRKIAS